MGKVTDAAGFPDISMCLKSEGLVTIWAIPGKFGPFTVFVFNDFADVGNVIRTDMKQIV